MWTKLLTAGRNRFQVWRVERREEPAKSERKDLEQQDFPIETDQTALKTSDGQPIAEAKSKKLADDIAERLNEQAYREEQDCWSA